MVKKAIFNQENILVIGGAGFIGSHLCDELIQRAKVLCVDNFLTGREDNIAHLLQNSNFKFINQDIVAGLDLENYPLPKQFEVAFQGLQEIYFLATPGSPKFYMDKPLETMMANSIGLRNALELAVKYKSKFLYISSPSVCADVFPTQPIDEKFIGPVNQLGLRACYSESLRFGETLVNNYRLQYNLDTKIVRLFNTYGPRMDLHDGRMIPELIKDVLLGNKITVYGEEKEVSSYCYIKDVIKGIVKVMARGENGPINLGSDWKITLSELAKKVSLLNDKNLRIVYEEKNQLMIKQPIPDITLMKEAIGWFPIVLIDEGLRETYDYLNAYKDILGTNKFGQ